MSDALKHWRLTYDSEEIAWAGIDRQGESANSLSREVLLELAALVDAVAARQPRGLVIHSAKKSGFIVGADIREFEGLGNPEEAAAHMRAVHDVLYRIEGLPFPTCAQIHGNCLGGGLEIALACRYRVALDDPDTKLGLPEIQLGIHPGFGGTVRSIARIGVMAAMDLMLTGRSLDARRAVSLGLVDRAVPARHFDTAARAMVLAPRPHKRPPLLARLGNTAPARPLVARLIERQAAERADPAHYPAPFAIIHLWRDYGGDPHKMMVEEARSVGRLFMTDTSRQLQRLFFLQERLKGYGRGTAFKPQHVHVIGAGTMGGDIAAWCVLRGLRVTLQDREARYVAPAIKRAHAMFGKRIRDAYARQRAQDRLIVDVAGRGIAKADVVIEAIIEDLAAKQVLLQGVEAQAGPAALLATNTSSIPLEDIAAGLREPARLVGLHFFNPVEKMQLVEIVGAAHTAREPLARAAAFTVRIGRLPLPAASAPGFLVNRILSPYLQEAILLLEEGATAEEVDAAATAFGMPMGPIELADVVGLDICLSVGKLLSAKLGGEVPALLQRKVDEGRLGRKTHGGFYRYKGATPIRSKRPGQRRPAREIQDRLLLRLLNEAVACLRQAVVTDSDLIDAGMVFGTGFAPFRGGPLRHARDRGVAEIRASLADLAARLGPRFTPDPGWDALEH